MIAWTEPEPSAVVPNGAVVSNVVVLPPGHRMVAGAKYVAKAYGDTLRMGWLTVESVDGDTVRLADGMWSAIPAIMAGDRLYRAKTHADLLEERLSKLERAVERLEAAK